MFDMAVRKIRVHDFRESWWGHALHAGTFSEAPKTWREKLFGRPRNKYSFLVHCSPEPMVGDQVVWTSPSGTKSARIYDVEYQPRVGDMYKLFVEMIS